MEGAAAMSMHEARAAIVRAMPRHLSVITALVPLGVTLSWGLLAGPAAATEPLLVPIDARIGTEARGRERGEQAARADIAAGLLRLYESTGPETARDMPRQALRERLLRAKGIRLELGAGCTDPGEQHGFHAAYNKAMAAEAQRRFGPDFWSRLDQTVDRQLREARAGATVRARQPAASAR